MSFTYHQRRKVRNTGPLKETQFGLPEACLGFISVFLKHIHSTSTFGIVKGTKQALPALEVSKNLPPIISVRLATYLTLPICGHTEGLLFNILSPV